MYANEDRWDPLVRPIAGRAGVPVALVKAVIGNETAFRWVGDPHPVKGTVIQAPADLDRAEPRMADASVGVMQILTGTASWVTGDKVSREELRDPASNIRIGTEYLAMLLHGWRPRHVYEGTRRVRTERMVPGGVRPLTVEETLAAYNGGPGILARRREDGTFPNQSYVDKGLRAYDYFAAQEQELPGPPAAPPASPPATAQGPPGAAIGLLVALGGALLLVGLRAR